MKKFLSVLTAVVLILCTAACHIQKTEHDPNKLSIVATIFPQFDFARQISGDKAEVTMLIPPGAESHSFEPTVSDITSISECDIFIYTGGESDTWIDSLLKNANNPQMSVISLVDCVDLSEEHNHNEEHNHSHVDEHVWTSPVNAVKICETICSELQKKDTANSEYYKQNLENYKAELISLDAKFRSVVKNAKHDTFVFADRFTLTHFAHEYGLNHYAAFSGCSEDTEPSANTVATLVDKVREENLSAVLKIELSSDSIAQTIKNETGAKILTFYSCHNISKTDFDNGETYLSLMQKNTETLKIALN